MDLLPTLLTAAGGEIPDDLAAEQPEIVDSLDAQFVDWQAQLPSTP